MTEAWENIWSGKIIYGCFLSFITTNFLFILLLIGLRRATYMYLGFRQCEFYFFSCSLAFNWFVSLMKAVNNDWKICTGCRGALCKNYWVGSNYTEKIIIETIIWKKTQKTCLVAKDSKVNTSRIQKSKPSEATARTLFVHVLTRPQLLPSWTNSRISSQSFWRMDLKDCSMSCNMKFSTSKRAKNKESFPSNWKWKLKNWRLKFDIRPRTYEFNLFQIFTM